MAELKRSKINGKKRLSRFSWILLMCLIPLVLAFVGYQFIKGNQMVQGKVNVDVVNNDKPVKVKGKQLAVGNQVVSNLKGNHTVKWDFVNNEQANDNVKRGKSIMSVTIPNDFSANSASALSSNPQPSEFQIKTSKHNTLLSQPITQAVSAQLNTEVTQNMQKASMSAILSAVKQLGSGMTQAADGSKALNKGASKLVSGNGQITSNLNLLSQKMVQFKDGTQQLSDGLGQYTNGVISLADGNKKLANGVATLNGGAKPLARGVKTLSGGSQSVTSGVQQTASAVSQAYSGSQQVNAGVDALVSQVSGMSSKVSELKQGLPNASNGVSKTAANDEAMAGQVKAMASKAPDDEKASLNNLADNLTKNADGQKQVASGLQQTSTQIAATSNDGAAQMKQLEYGAQSLTDGLGKLNSNMPALTAGTRQLSGGLGQLNLQVPTLTSGIRSLNNGAQSAANGAGKLTAAGSKLNSGVAALNQGTAEAGSGVNQLASGSQGVQSGIQQLGNGTSQLATKLGAGAKTVGKVPAGSQNVAQMITPVKNKVSNPSFEKNIKSVLAPAIIAVALFVASIIIQMIIDGIKDHESISRKMKRQMPLIIGVVSLVETLLVDFISLLYGVTPVNFFLFILLTLIVALSFNFLSYFVNEIIGIFGLAILMIIFVLQVTLSLNIIPLGFLSGFWAFITSILPMTYAVQSLNLVVNGVPTSLLLMIILLVIYPLAFFLIKQIVIRIQKARKD